MTLDYSLFFFLLFGCLAIIFALGTLIVEKLMHAVLALFLFLITIALMFLLMNNEYLFIIQLTLYCGGISVLFLFATVLTINQQETAEKTNTYWSGFIAFIFVLALSLVVYSIDWVSDWANYSLQRYGDQSLFREFAEQLFKNYPYTVAILGLLLLTTLIGSSKLALKEEDEDA
ncbi:MAG: NADH-quinone oxidoreductase subunit J family protein [Candidatus Kariarchaeaceae archaeon]